MFAGELVSIFVAAQPAGRMEALQEADAVPGKGR